MGIGALAAAYVALRIIAFAAATTLRCSDTAAFEEFDVLARGSSRLPTVPLLYLTVSGDGARPVAQLAISVVCWLALASVIAGVVRSRSLRPAAFALVLAVSLVRPVLVWDRILIAESVMFSTTAGLVAAWIGLLAWPSAWTAASVATLTVFWGFGRETHIVLLLYVAFFAALGLVRRWDFYQGISLCVTLVVAGAGLTLLSQSPTRKFFAMQNVIAQRILPEPRFLEHFRAAGMPMTPELVSLSGKYASSDDWLFYESPNLEDFRGWLHRDFDREYVLFLAANPAWSLSAPFADPRFWRQDIEIYIDGRPGALPSSLERFLLPGKGILAILGAVVALAIASAARFGAKGYWAVPIAVIVSTLPHGLIVWHGDAMEVDRHLVPVAANLRLGIVLLLIFALDAALCSWNRATRGGPCPGGPYARTHNRRREGHSAP